MSVLKLYNSMLKACISWCYLIGIIRCCGGEGEGNVIYINVDCTILMVLSSPSIFALNWLPKLTLTLPIGDPTFLPFILESSPPGESNL